jgi:hypothetical protein
MTAFVLGNGVSRRHIDVDRLLTLAPVYGCNALYRTHVPTVLVATDRPIADAIQASGYCRQNLFYTRRPQANLGAQRVPETWFGFSSGPIAVALAAARETSPIYLLGFDMGPAPSGRFNNVFADTEFYKSAASPPTFTGNWERQLVRVMREFSASRFVRVHGESTAEIPALASAPNLERMEIQEFVRRINNPKDL